MVKILVVGLGGFVGAVCRYGISDIVDRRDGGGLSVGTLLVNVLGCFAMGVIATLVEDKQWFSDQTRLLLTVGLLGSFTTFSTFSHGTLNLARDGAAHLALANVGANVILALAAVWLGRLAVQSLAG